MKRNPRTNETPVQVSRPIQAGIIARRFRAAASQFRNPTGRLELLHIGGERFIEFPAGLKNRCGEWLIAAHEAGLIPANEKALIEYIAFHTATNTPLPKGVQAQYLRCAHNRFCDVVGGNVVSGTLEGIDERGRIKLSNQRETGGLLPRIDQQHLNQTIPERFAAACEYLADLIESAGKLRGKTVKGESPRRGRPRSPDGVRAIAERHKPGESWAPFINEANKKYPRPDGRSWAASDLRDMLRK